MFNKLAAIIFLVMISFVGKAQKTYEILSDPEQDNAKMLKGFISKEDISNEPLFTWYAQSQRIF